ncbi:CLUMA_CG021588, isoform A [Clunio marinus]|uniref:CLUMA_CG021588, isoform A n=1 Tax=Clunio marinus TaxID=568069 RepID=A0A1J1J9I6_9DIPT|nr:CLUMA_CG021588, isoform A [Clunio marinus]
MILILMLWQVFKTLSQKNDEREYVATFSLNVKVEAEGSFNQDGNVLPATHLLWRISLRKKCHCTMAFDQEVNAKHNNSSVSCYQNFVPCDENIHNLQEITRKSKTIYLNQSIENRKGS